MTEKVDAKALKQPKDIVAQDRNWTLRVNNELTAEQKWSNQWGFYEKGTVLITKDSLLKKEKLKKKKPLTIELSNSRKKFTQLMEKFSKLLHQHMEKEIMLRFIRIVNTTFTKIKI
jgi:predicted HNH restriction endonuclease